MRENQLTQGRVGPALLRFALPFLAASFLQQLYSVVDMVAVGRLSTAAALSGVSTGSEVLHTITALIMGLATGATVLIGQYVGAGRREDVSKTIGTVFPLFGIFAVGISVLMAVFAKVIVAAMQVPEAAVADAERYLFICAVGMIFVTGYNMVSGILRGLGDSKSPMVLVAIACVINIVGDFVLVGPFHMGAAGAAVATVAAQGFSFLLALVVLRRREDFPFDFQLRSFVLRREHSRLLLKLGIPVGLQDMLIGFSFMLITSFINRIGLEQSAGAGVVAKVTAFTMMVSIAFMSAIAAMTAQNIGSGQAERAKSALRWGILCSFACSLVLFTLVQLVPERVLSLFSDQSGVVEQGALYLRSNMIDTVLVAFVFCFNGFFSGCGHTNFSLLNNLIATFGVRVTGTLIISLIPGATMFHIGLAAPAASALQIIIQLVYLRFGNWQKSTILSNG